MRKWIAAAAIAAGLCFAAAAPAQITTTHYARSQFDAWTFAPIVTDDAIAGFLCWADPTALTGENIPIIWYHRQANGEWSTSGWQDYDLGSAVMYIRAAYQDDAIFEVDPTLSCAMEESSELTQPKEIIDGLYFDDPAHILLEETNDPESVMVMLVHIGWEAAPDLSILEVDANIPDCDELADDAKAIDLLLNEMAVKLEFAIFAEVFTDAECFPVGCTGCVHHYAPAVRKPNSGWIYRYSGTSPVTGERLCYYEYPATQYWYLTGQETDCDLCSGSGTDNVVIRGMTVVPAGASCTPPNYLP
jgi:hypothetical protein